MPDMTPTSLAATVEPRTGKIIKNGLRLFERAENLLKYYTLHWNKAIVRNHVTKLELDQKRTFLKGAWHLKG